MKVCKMCARNLLLWTELHLPITPRNLYVEAFTTTTPHVTEFGDRAIKEVIQMKRGHKGGVFIRTGVFVRRDTRNVPVLRKGHVRTQ